MKLFKKLWGMLKPKKKPESPTINAIYRPSNWVVLKLEDDKTIFYKVLGVFRHSDWRVNSGIESVEEDEEHYYFYGMSGSLYICKKTLYGVDASFFPLNHLLQVDKVKVMPKSTKFLKLCTTQK
jgi:hypothetical protein